MMASALIGKPVSHSIGQYIYNRLFDVYNIDSIYLSIDIDENNIKKFIEYSRRNFIGFNVTAPYKEVIMKYLNDIDLTAKNIGSVNLVKNLYGKLYGYNSDYNGFLFLLKNNNVDLNGKNVLILGTGGIAKTIIYAIKNNYNSSITAATRNINNKKLGIKTIKYDDINGYDVVINCTPVGTDPDVNMPLNESKINDNITGIDVIYNPLETEFLRAVKNKNGIAVNGSDLFIGQGIETLKKLYSIDIRYDEFKAFFMKKINNAIHFK